MFCLCKSTPTLRRESNIVRGCVFKSFIDCKEMGDYAIFPVFYFTVRRFILRKYDRSCVNNVSVNNEPGVSAMLVRLPQLKGCDR